MQMKQVGIVQSLLGLVGYYIQDSGYPVKGTGTQFDTANWNEYWNTV